MIKKYEFIERTLYLIREKLEKRLPDETTLEEMIEKTKKIIKEIY
jgi:ASC-1-like (ASCH) protein